MSTASPMAGQRGPAEHSIREQIVVAANKHFSHYGYEKTTVSDLAKAVGFSKAYIYKFFDSKQAIGEAICSDCLDALLASGDAAIADGKSASDKYRRLFKALVTGATELFFEDRKLYDIAAHAASEKWPITERYQERVLGLIETVIREGRESGEFERKTPLDEVCRAVLHVMQPFINPLMLQYKLDELPDAPNEVASLVLRSLAA